MKNKIVSLIFILFFLHFTFLIFHSSIAFAIEVGGHITENTVWSPENNPYNVVHDVIVDENVTLTILPGTEVKFDSTILADPEDFDNFIYYNGSNIAKMLMVDGKVIAEGTEDNPITFTRAQDELYYHWGVIYLTEFADRSIFKYCNIEYAAQMLIVLGIIPIGGISTYNEEVIIENCNFIDNFCGVYIQRYPQKTSVNNNHFYNIENINPNVVGSAAGGISIGAGTIAEPDLVLVAGNRFNESNIDDTYLTVHNVPIYSVYNQFNGAGINANMDFEAASYFYKNNFIDCTDGIEGGDPVDSIYIKSNSFIGGHRGIHLYHGYVEISDNYFEDCDLDTWYNSYGKVYNNYHDDGGIFIGENIEFYNNIICNNVGSNPTYTAFYVHDWGNILFNNESNFADACNNFHNNSIILQNDELYAWPMPNGTDTFRNCIIDFELEYPMLDGGGNIIVDSIQAQSIFEDIQNGDFHLTANSIAIDAGFDTLGYYYPFDLDYNHRVWDGDNNGTSIIDIGPYEFGSPTFGGIEGYTYNPSSGDPVDYVLLEINDQPGEFTFSDSLGNFEYKLPAGVYDVYAERVFYEDIIEYQVEVIEGDFTQIAIPMLEIVEMEENTINFLMNNFKLTNYPNPFNPTTTINFSLPEDSNVELSIYNVKGQKVRTLTNEFLEKGTHSIGWNGRDNNNKSASTGIYFYKISAGKSTTMRKMLLLK